MQWTTFDRYVFRNLLLSTVLICGILTLLIMVVQSIRFLELVMESGATMAAFSGLLMLSVPRFVEAVLPISLMVSVLFFYNKIIMDNEMVMMRAAGSSHITLMRPVIIISAVLMIGLFIISAWIAPQSIAKIQTLRQDIRAQYTSLLFREGIFNTVGSGLTAYIRHRDSEGILHGLMIHDTRKESEGGNAYTVVAQRGVSLNDGDGQKVIVYDGTRQELDKQRGTLSRLDFEQYTIDIPERAEDIRARWKEPDERTLPALLDIDSLPQADEQHIPQFIGEANRRMSLPFLLLAYSLISGCFLMLGPIDRRGLGRRILLASVTVLMVQGLYMLFYNLTKQHGWANIILYIMPLGICGFCFYLLSARSEDLRARWHNYWTGGGAQSS